MHPADPRSSEAIPAFDSISVSSSRPATGGQGGAMRNHGQGKVRKVQSSAFVSAAQARNAD